MILVSEISKCSEYGVKAKTGNVFVNERILDECCVKIYEIDPQFYEHYNELIKSDKNGLDYMLFKIDFYFIEQKRAVEIDEKAHLDRDLIFEEKRQEALAKKPNCEFI